MEEAGVSPEFRMRVIEDGPASLEAGRPIHKEVEWVDIHIIGDKNTKPSMKVTDEHRNRWPEQYQAFISGVEAPLRGTALEEWTGISRSKAEDLRAMRLRTVEDIAGLPENAISRLGMGARELVSKAKLFVEGKNSADTLRDENDALKARLDALESSLAKSAEKPAKKKAPKKAAKQDEAAA